MLNFTDDKNGSVQFYNKGDGRFYRLVADGTVERLSEETFYNVEQVTWANQKDIAVINPQAERDFKQIDSLKLLFCDYPEECEQYEKYNFLEKTWQNQKIYTV